MKAYEGITLKVYANHYERNLIFNEIYEVLSYFDIIKRVKKLETNDKESTELQFLSYFYKYV
ncbi:MAG: hypothetical protein AABY36_06035 [Campylobacterota bacterium]